MKTVLKDGYDIRAIQCSDSQILLQSVRGELVEPQMENSEYIALRLAQGER